MLSRFIKSNIQNCYILLPGILLSALYSQGFQSKSNLEFNPNFSNQWWSQYNNYGHESSKINFRYNGEYQKNKTEYHFSFLASKDRISISESFIKSPLFNNTYLKAGRYYRDFSLYLNDELSSGSMLVSNNAEPMPKIGILSVYHYKDLDFNFGIAHGSFRKSEIYTKAPMLHEKFIYLNSVKDDHEFSIGIVHEAMWGGATESSGDFPDSFKDFLKVFISEDGPLIEGQSHANALGNHLGIWDFYYKRKIKNKELKLYYQHFFEDTSGLRFWNRLDGLWGVEFSDHLRNTNVLFEYLNTENQDRDPPYVNESYYNHSEYKNGWSYKGYTLGNPFINHLNNNPSKVLHLGIIKNDLNQYDYKLLASRRINKSDPLKYEISISKNANQFLVGLILRGEEGKSNNLGIKISYQL
tara:strand:+ start:803 stop:2038 length:1236 start_codon:yes stop_codon:yes gene_type:complete